jgi:ribosomal protein S27AE
VVLDQFANEDNPRIHYETTGPEIWADTQGRVTHFVSAMGTTGTITGVSRYLKERNPAVHIVIGAQPSEGSRIPGIRKWPQEYLPKIYDPQNVDELVYVSQVDAEEMCRRMAREEGIFAGISAAGACWVAQEMARKGVMRRSCSWSATVATATCRPVSSRPDAVSAPLNSGDDRPAGWPEGWHWCPRCATALAWLAAEEDGGLRHRVRCPACGFTHWNNPVPVLAAVVECVDQGGRVLLARNAAGRRGSSA